MDAGDARRVERGADVFDLPTDPIREVTCPLLDAEDTTELGEVRLEHRQVGEALAAVLREQERVDTGGLEGVAAAALLLVERAAHARDHQVGLEVDDLLPGGVLLGQRRDGVELVGDLRQHVVLIAVTHPDDPVACTQLDEGLGDVVVHRDDALRRSGVGGLALAVADGDGFGEGLGRAAALERLAA